VSDSVQTPERLQHAVATLRRRRAELERAGVQHLAIFGSVARGEDRPDSDVDILVTIAPGAQVGLLELVRMSRQLESWLGRKIDLAEPEGLRHESDRAEGTGGGLLADEFLARDAASLFTAPKILI
jgi:predicted nucleotidyltransferase